MDLCGGFAEHCSKRWSNKQTGEWHHCVYPAGHEELFPHLCAGCHTILPAK